MRSVIIDGLWRALFLVWSVAAFSGLAIAQELPVAVDDASDRVEDVDDTGGDGHIGEPEPAMDLAYVRDLHATEAQVQELKERVFRSKATLQLLRELIVEGSSTGSGVRIVHVHELASAYRVERIRYFLDGKNIFVWASADGAEQVPAELDVRDEPVGPGEHSLQVRMLVRGNGGKVFSYVDDYRFTVDSSYTFEVEEGMMLELRVIATSKGGVKKRFVDRPTIEYLPRRVNMRAE